jgi:hypothetical protein
MRDAIVAPAGLRSIASMRPCLVRLPVPGLDVARAVRACDFALLGFRAVELAAAFLDLLVMGFP